MASPTIAVRATADGKVLTKEAFESIIWHELQSSLGHHATFVNRVDIDLLDTMRREKLTTLLEIDIQWKVDVIRLKDGRRAGGHFPTVKTREWALLNHQLVAQKEWTTTGSVALYRVDDGPKNELIAIPEISLQSAMKLALEPIEAPFWGRAEPWIRVPVLALADEEYREFYGDQWTQEIRTRVERANALLRPAGIVLDIEKMSPWVSNDRSTTLSMLLDEIASLPREQENQLRIGFTQQTKLAVKFHREIEDVGRAYLPGRDLIIADQAVVPGNDQSWDVAEEGVAIAHETLHAFGVPHQTESAYLMSASKVGTVHRISDKTIALARTAAQARFSHWDPNTTLESLSNTAEKHLSNQALQIDYIAENFVNGTGYLRADRLEPKRLSALGNLAIGHYYLRQALQNPGVSNRLAKRALIHTESALAQNPSWVPASELKAAILNLGQPDAREPTVQNEPGELQCDAIGYDASMSRPSCD